MQVTVKTVNATGRAEIKAFLCECHKSFLETEPTDAMLDAWCAEAERHGDDDGDLYVELKSWESAGGWTEILNVSARGVDISEVEVDA